MSGDYTVLLHSRFDYSYVRSISGKSSHRLRIIHISDLHIRSPALGKPSKADQIIEQLSRYLDLPVNDLIEHRKWVDGKDPADVSRLCLAHYSPSCELSCFPDNYDVL